MFSRLPYNLDNIYIASFDPGYIVSIGGVYSQTQVEFKKSMKALFVDSSSYFAQVALFEGATLYKKLEFEMGPLATQDLFVEIVQLLSQEKIRLSDLSYLSLGIGPGSYTGMRKSASIIASLAYATKLPCVSISSLDGYLPTKNGPFAVVVTAKRGRLFTRMGDRKEDDIFWETEPNILTVNQLMPYIGDGRLLVTPHLKEIDGLFTGHSVIIEEVPFNLEMAAKMCDTLYKEGKFTSINPIPLIYLQDPYFGSVAPC